MLRIRTSRCSRCRGQIRCDIRIHEMLSHFDGCLVLGSPPRAHLIQHLNHEIIRALIVATGSQYHLKETRIVFSKFRKYLFYGVFRVSIGCHGLHLMYCLPYKCATLSSIKLSGLRFSLRGKSANGNTVNATRRSIHLFFFYIQSLKPLRSTAFGNSRYKMPRHSRWVFLLHRPIIRLSAKFQF